MAICGNEFKMRTINRTCVVTGIQQEQMCECCYIYLGYIDIYDE